MKTPILGSEALTAALGVYSYTKNSPAGSALEGVANELGRRFTRKPRQAESKNTEKPE